MATQREVAAAAALSDLLTKREGLSNSINNKKKEKHSDNGVKSITYASRMTYLNNGNEKSRPDDQYLNKKKTKNLSQGMLKVQFVRKLDIPTKTTKRKSQQFGKRHTDSTIDKRKSEGSRWVKTFQAGCVFWENMDTGECMDIDPNLSTSKEVFQEPDQVTLPIQFSILKDSSPPCKISDGDIEKFKAQTHKLFTELKSQ